MKQEETFASSSSFSWLKHHGAFINEAKVLNQIIIESESIKESLQIKAFKSDEHKVKCEIEWGSKWILKCSFPLFGFFDPHGLSATSFPEKPIQ